MCQVEKKLTRADPESLDRALNSDKEALVRECGVGVFFCLFDGFVGFVLSTEGLIVKFSLDSDFKTLLLPELSKCWSYRAAQS